MIRPSRSEIPDSVLRVSFPLGVGRLSGVRMSKQGCGSFVFISALGIDCVYCRKHVLLSVSPLRFLINSFG